MQLMLSGGQSPCVHLVFSRQPPPAVWLKTPERGDRLKIGDPPVLTLRQKANSYNKHDTHASTELPSPPWPTGVTTLLLSNEARSLRHFDQPWDATVMLFRRSSCHPPPPFVTLPLLLSPCYPPLVNLLSSPSSCNPPLVTLPLLCSPCYPPRPPSCVA